MNENDILMYENDEFDSNLEDFYNYFMKQNETDLLRDFIENAGVGKEFKEFVDDEFQDYYYEKSYKTRGYE